MSEIHEHLEHAEHAEHAAHNPFDKRIAMTIAIVAALLAGVAMVGHRKHNETLFKQGEANRAMTAATSAQTEATKYQTEAGKYKVEASNNWAWYQAKRLRQAQYEAYAEMVPLFAAAPGIESQREKAVGRWNDKIKSYKKELASKKEDPEAYASKDNIPHKADEAQAKAEEFEAKAEKAGAQSVKQLEISKQAIRDSTHSHHQADWLDYAHLAVELGLVLCSIAVLTKIKAFWFSGIAISVVGIVLVIYAMSIPVHEHHDEHSADTPHHHQEHNEDGKHELPKEDGKHKAESTGH